MLWKMECGQPGVAEHDIFFIPFLHKRRADSHVLDLTAEVHSSRTTQTRSLVCAASPIVKCHVVCCRRYGVERELLRQQIRRVLGEKDRAQHKDGRGRWSGGNRSAFGLQTTGKYPLLEGRRIFVLSASFVGTYKHDTQ